MLDKPNLPDELLIDCLRRDFGLPVARVEFLPLGADVNTAVYQANTGGTAYFVKLRSGEFNDLTIVVPHLLEAQGIGHLIAPVAAAGGRLWTRLDRFAVILYPFIQGQDGFTLELNDRQWFELGHVLKGVHAARLPDEIFRGLPRETFQTVWFERTQEYLELFARETFSDPISAQLAGLMRAQRNVIEALIRRAEARRGTLLDNSPAFVPCHADIHGGNVLIEPNGHLHVVDWDTLLFAPKERDLMFIGGGIGKGWDGARGIDQFYQGYGSTDIDLAGIAYYRYVRILEDIVVYCEQILESDPGSPDRDQGLISVSSNFLPNETIEIALRADPDDTPA